MDVHSDPLLGPLERTPEGVRAGDCVLVEKIGQGGMGAVYLGKHLTLDIDVAIKVLPFHAVTTDSTAVSRFQKEARSTVRIDHPNVVRVFHVGEESGVHYLVMEHIDGESAAARIERERALPERDALEIAIAAGEALSAAHAEGILHRDVKPANILIRFRDGRVKLADLGLAKALGGEGGETAGLTATGQMLGTPAYMSPEQAEDASRADERTDIYSLGGTLYALLSGKAPFEATQLLKLLLKVTREEPKELRKLRRDVSEGTAEAVKKLMRKDPAERPQTMKEVVGLLRDCLDAAPTKGARGLARPEMAGSRKVKITVQAGTPTPAMPRTLDDVTPSQVRRESDRGHVPGEAGYEARPPVAVRMTGGRKLAIVLGIIAAIGAAGGAAAYLYSERRAADARLAEEEGRRQEKLAEERRRQDEEIKRSEAEQAAAEKKRHEEEARRAQEERKRKEVQAKAASHLKTARSFREAGLLDKARDEAAESLKIIPDNAEAKRLLAEIQSQIAAKKSEAERAVELKKWMDEGLRLRLAGKLQEAATAYERAQASAPAGSTSAAEAAAGCLAEHLKSQAIDAEARGDYEKAVAFYAQAVAKKDDPATRAALTAAKKKLDAKRAEEAKRAEAARWKSRAKETYEDAMRELKMAEEDDKIGILREAKAKVAGTDYEVRLHKQIASLEADQKEDTAEAIYKEVLEKIKAAPDAFEENLEALEVAFEKVKDTRYEDKLESMIGKKRKTLKTDIAKAALDEVTAAVKKAPEDYDENIATAEAALPNTEGTKYEKALKKKLEGLKADRLDKIGKEAYEAARARLKESPKDYAGNVAALRDLKTKAEGSAYEAKIAKELFKQEKKLARAR